VTNTTAKLYDIIVTTLHIVETTRSVVEIGQ